MKDSLYRALAWGGLQETDIFKSKPNKCDLLRINFAARRRFEIAPIPITYLGTFSSCSQTINFDATTLKLKNPCD